MTYGLELELINTTTIRAIVFEQSELGQSVHNVYEYELTQAAALNRRLRTDYAQPRITLVHDPVAYKWHTVSPRTVWTRAMKFARAKQDYDIEQAQKLSEWAHSL